MGEANISPQQKALLERISQLYGEFSFKQTDEFFIESYKVVKLPAQQHLKGHIYVGTWKEGKR